MPYSDAPPGRRLLRLLLVRLGKMPADTVAGPLLQRLNDSSCVRLSGYGNYGWSEMRVSDRFAPVAAVMSAFGALACCLPFGIAGAMGALGLSVFFERMRPWLIGFAFVLLTVGVFQMVRRQTSCQKRSRFSIALLVFCAAIVLSILLFPQQVASLMADLDFRGAR